MFVPGDQPFEGLGDGRVVIYPLGLARRMDGGEVPGGDSVARCVPVGRDVAMRAMEDNRALGAAIEDLILRVPLGKVPPQLASVVR